MTKSQIVKEIINSVINDMDVSDKFDMMRYLYCRYEQELAHEDWEACDAANTKPL